MSEVNNKERLTWEETMTYTAGGSGMIAAYEWLDALDFEYQPETIPGMIAYYSAKVGLTLASGFLGGLAGKYTGRGIDGLFDKRK